MSETTRRSFLSQLISGAMVAAAGVMAAGEVLAQAAKKQPPRPKDDIAVKYGVPAPPSPDKDDKKKKKPPKKKCKRGEDCDSSKVRPKYGVPVRPKYGVPVRPKYGVPQE